MADLIAQERLQPALLDRLTDLEPSKTQESREDRVISMAKLRESVRRDVTWLFNTVQLSATESLDDYPNVASSVLNFGIPALAGNSIVRKDVRRLEEAILTALARFEPRILPGTLGVEVASDSQEYGNRALHFAIRGEMWARPVPQSLYLKTELDLESGTSSVVDQGR